MPTRHLCMNLITSWSDVWKVTLITPMRAMFLLLWDNFFSWTSPNLILHFQRILQPGKTILTNPKMCKNTQQWTLHLQAYEYVVVLISTNYKDPHGWAYCLDRFIWIVKPTNTMHIFLVRAIVWLVHMVWENAASDRIDSIWLVNNHVDLYTYWTVYYLGCLNQSVQK